MNLLCNGVFVYSYLIGKEQIEVLLADHEGFKGNCLGARDMWY